MFGPSPTTCAGGYRDHEPNYYWADKRTVGLMAGIAVRALGLILSLAL